jgi:hypothetical protein
MRFGKAEEHHWYTEVTMGTVRYRAKGSKPIYEAVAQIRLESRATGHKKEME